MEAFLRQPILGTSLSTGEQALVVCDMAATATQAVLETPASSRATFLNRPEHRSPGRVEGWSECAPVIIPAPVVESSLTAPALVVV